MSVFEMGNCGLSTTLGNNNSYNVPTSAPTNEETGTIVHDGSVLSVLLIRSANELKEQIISCGDDNLIFISNVSDFLANQYHGPVKRFCEHTKAVNKILHADGKIWSTSRDLSVKLWDLEKTVSTLTIEKAHELNISAIAMNPCNSEVVYTGSRDYSVKGWDTQTGNLVSTFTAKRNIVTTMNCSSSHPNVIYQGSEDLCVRIWDTRLSSAASPAQVIADFVYFPVSADISADGVYLATGCKGFDSIGCTVKVWDLRNTSQMLSEYAGHSHDVVGCKFSTKFPHLLISASKDGSVRLWDSNHCGKHDSSGNACISSLMCSGKLLSCIAVPEQNDKFTDDKAVQNWSVDLVLGSSDGTTSLASINDKMELLETRGNISRYPES